MGAGMSITAEARQTLAEALGVAVAPVPVFDVRPLELVTPCVYLDVAGRRAADDDGAPLIVVTFPVVAVVDGTDEAQLRALDVLDDQIWDAALELSGEPVSAVADDLDVGGPRLRALITVVDVVVAHLTLCAEKELVA